MKHSASGQLSPFNEKWDEQHIQCNLYWMTLYLALLVHNHKFAGVVVQCFFIIAIVFSCSLFTLSPVGYWIMYWVLASFVCTCMCLAWGNYVIHVHMRKCLAYYNFHVCVKGIIWQNIWTLNAELEQERVFLTICRIRNIIAWMHVVRWNCTM